MPTISTAKPAELVTQVIIDNAAGGAFDYTLIEFNIVTNLVTLGDGSQNDVTKWIQNRLVTVYDNAPAAQISFTAACRAILNIQNLAPSGAQLAQVITLVGDVFAFKVTIPAAYNSAFLWGATASIDGGFALSGSYPSGAAGVTTVTASAPLASSGGATPNISVTGVLGTGFGGTGQDNSAANGVIGVSGGAGGVTPLAYMNLSQGAEALNTIPVLVQLRNGTVNFTTPDVLVWGQIAPGATLANITLAAGAEGQVFGMDDFATSGRFAIISGATGKINLLVTNTTAAETILVLLGPGPGTNNLLLGNEIELAFA